MRDCHQGPRGRARSRLIPSCPASMHADRSGSTPPIIAEGVFLLPVDRLCSGAGRCIIGRLRLRCIDRRDHSTYCSAVASLILALAPIRGLQPIAIWRWLPPRCETPSDV